MGVVDEGFSHVTMCVVKRSKLNTYLHELLPPLEQLM